MNNKLISESTISSFSEFLKNDTIFNEMALKSRTVWNLPTLFDEKDLEFLHQFPPTDEKTKTDLWLLAMIWRYRDGIFKASTYWSKKYASGDYVNVHDVKTDGSDGKPAYPDIQPVELVKYVKNVASGKGEAKTKKALIFKFDNIKTGSMELFLRLCDPEKTDYDLTDPLAKTELAKRDAKKYATYLQSVESEEDAQEKSKEYKTASLRRDYRDEPLLFNTTSSAAQHGPMSIQMKSWLAATQAGLLNSKENFPKGKVKFGQDHEMYELPMVSKDVGEYEIIEYTPLELQKRGRRKKDAEVTTIDPDLPVGSPGGPRVIKVSAKQHQMPVLGEGRFLNPIICNKDKLTKQLLGFDEEMSKNKLNRFPLVSTTKDNPDGLTRTSRNLKDLLTYQVGSNKNPEIERIIQKINTIRVEKNKTSKDQIPLITDMQKELRLSDAWVKEVEKLIDEAEQKPQDGFTVINLLRIFNPRQSYSSWFNPAKMQRKGGDPSDELAKESVTGRTWYLMQNFNLLPDYDKETLLKSGVKKEDAWKRGKGGSIAAQRSEVGDEDENSEEDEEGELGGSYVGGFSPQQAFKKQATAIDAILGGNITHLNGREITEEEKKALIDIYSFYKEGAAMSIIRGALLNGEISVGGGKKGKKKGYVKNLSQDNLKALGTSLRGDEDQPDIVAANLAQHVIKTNPDHALSDWKEDQESGEAFSARGWVYDLMKGALLSYLGYESGRVPGGGSLNAGITGSDGEESGSAADSVTKDNLASLQGGEGRGMAGGALGREGWDTGAEVKAKLALDIQSQLKIQSKIKKINELIDELVLAEQNNKRVDKYQALENVWRDKVTQIRIERLLAYKFPSGFKLRDAVDSVNRISNQSSVSVKVPDTLDDIKNLTHYNPELDQHGEKQIPNDKFADELEIFADELSINFNDDLNAKDQNVKSWIIKWFRKGLNRQEVELKITHELETIMQMFEKSGLKTEIMKQYWPIAIDKSKELLDQIWKTIKDKQDSPTEPKISTPTPTPLPQKPLINASRDEIDKATNNINTYYTHLKTAPQLVVVQFKNRPELLKSLPKWGMLTKDDPQTQMMYNAVVQTLEKGGVKLEMSLPMGTNPGKDTIGKIHKCANVWGVPNGSTGVSAEEPKKKFKSLKEYLEEHSLDSYKQRLMERVERNRRNG